MTTVVERFLKYVSYDTQSDEAYDTCPSTEKQLLLANELKRELEEMGASDVRIGDLRKRKKRPHFVENQISKSLKELFK